MLKRWQFWLSTLVATVALALVVTNMTLFASNRNLQQQIAARQQFIQQSVQLESIYQQLIKSLAELSTANNDEQLRTVLASQGITVTRNAAPADAAPSRPAGPARKQTP